MASKKTQVVSKAQLSKSIVDAGFSQPATELLTGNLNTKTIAGAQGTNVEDLVSDETTLFCVVLDETLSMTPNRDAVVTAFGEMLKALKDSKASEKILMSVLAFNTQSRLIHGYLPLEMVPELTDYHPNSETALYDATLDALTSMIAYEQQLKSLGNRTQVVVVVFTDGEDICSHHPASDVRQVAVELLTRETYVLSLVSFEQNPGDEVGKQAAEAMGFPNLLMAGSAAHDIRIAMGTVSQSVKQVSMGQIGSKSKSGFFNT